MSFSSKGRRRGASEGATAVEFALVAGPLFFMIFALLELALVFIVSTTLENAMNHASREIRTGEQQEGAAGKTVAIQEQEYVAKICDRMAFLEAHCASHLYVDVRTMTQYSTAGAPSPVTGGAFSDTNLTFNSGGQSQIVLARAFYRWPLLTPFLKEGLAKVNGNEALIVATNIFSNEPFGT